MRYDDAYEDTYEDIDDGAYGDILGLSEVLRRVLCDELRSASPEELDNAVAEVMDTMSAAEAFNFAKALQQIGRSASQVLANPAVRSVLRTAVPLVTGAVGTFFGGPLGAKVGSELGSTLVKGLPNASLPRSATSPRPATPLVAPGRSAAGGTFTASPASPVAGGSAAAAQGLVLTQHPDVLQALLSLALGQVGKPSINGAPVPQIMTMLSDVFGRAAAHADELMYMHPEAYAGEDMGDEIRAPDSHALYVTLMDADSYELAETLDGAA